MKAIIYSSFLAILRMSYLNWMLIFNFNMVYSVMLLAFTMNTQLGMR